MSSEMEVDENYFLLHSQLRGTRARYGCRMRGCEVGKKRLCFDLVLLILQL
ncbi:hypothetical protein [Campylobacter troglodytis]|uniref:hypothetical protein n=1 Tax=Campylobacter troglodytis TaxID=654363 RepID=UPI00163BFDC4|nr:hypothetical protein [Campylobacter troglodytis]